MRVAAWGALLSGALCLLLATTPWAWATGLELALLGLAARATSPACGPRPTTLGAWGLLGLAALATQLTVSPHGVTRSPASALALGLLAASVVARALALGVSRREGEPGLGLLALPLAALAWSRLEACGVADPSSASLPGVALALLAALGPVGRLAERAGALLLAGALLGVGLPPEGLALWCLAAWTAARSEGLLRVTATLVLVGLAPGPAFVYGGQAPAPLVLAWLTLLPRLPRAPQSPVSRGTSERSARS